ncbi:hypothetical protein Tco_0401113 [Tanacetum coccineum]
MSTLVAVDNSCLIESIYGQTLVLKIKKQPIVHRKAARDCGGEVGCWNVGIEKSVCSVGRDIRIGPSSHDPLPIQKTTMAS